MCHSNTVCIRCLAFLENEVMAFIINLFFKLRAASRSGMSTV